MFQSSRKPNSILLVPIHAKFLEDWLVSQDKKTQNWVNNQGFIAADSQFCTIPNEVGDIGKIVFGVSDDDHLRWALGHISPALPEGNYHLDEDLADDEAEALAVGWGLGQYSFDMTVKPKDKSFALLYIKNIQSVLAVVDAITLVRDLVNTPANHMMPKDLSKATQKLARRFNAEFSEVTDQKLLEVQYPAVYAVGKASDYKPRMLKLDWQGAESSPKNSGDPENAGDANIPHVCLVGKGVCFDTGGLDIKPAKFMRNMKKDMGGGAHVLGLASLIMAMKLPIKLTVLISAVDNAISGNAFRPGDVINTRAGMTVEIDNTDAEGRLVLCDALTEVSALKPDLIIDFATLTGAARVALGTEVPVYFSNSQELASDLNNASIASGEPIWQLPLHKPYFSQLKSSVADFTNSSPEGYGGAITAALFLNEFVPGDIPWVHFDVMAWNIRSRSGRPQGGEAMGLFAVSQYLFSKYS